MENYSVKDSQGCLHSVDADQTLLQGADVSFLVNSKVVAVFRDYCSFKKTGVKRSSSK